MLPSQRGTYSKEIMDKLDLFIDCKWFLCEIRQETAPYQHNLSSTRWSLTYLLRYLAIGSALFILKSFKNPEKLNVGSCVSSSSSLSCCCCCLSRPAGRGVEGPAPAPAPLCVVVGILISSASFFVGPGAGVANGSNSDISIVIFPICISLA